MQRFSHSNFQARLHWGGDALALCLWPHDACPKARRWNRIIWERRHRRQEAHTQQVRTPFANEYTQSACRSRIYCGYASGAQLGCALPPLRANYRSAMHLQPPPETNQPPTQHASQIAAVSSLRPRKPVYIFVAGVN
jgi:hypothetical protein